ncbi:MAG: ankyrin repeat domain-containing protein, partial [Proteobacteria bacterium]|nr:ankyrin repeat domain-containing protein [Pseudomonadota bacterium]
MKILEYSGINPSRCKSQYKKIVAAIERDDFKTAEVKKLANISHGKFYRAKLDYANRLLFTIVRHNDEVYALLLEVIENHDYAKSRFLRGAQVDDDTLTAIDPAQLAREAEAVRYVHRERREIHFLDKMISFDDAQEAVYRLPPPVILVGSAGSGKTALTLEKMKHIEGEVLYVTHSAYLAQSARNLYYGHGFERDGQEAAFFSFWEFMESIRVPRGREASWRDFAAWFSRMRQQFKGIDAHQAFEEIRGVIGGDPAGTLDRESYIALGVRQSIFTGVDRERAYDLFEKYREWLGATSLVDLNFLAGEWLEWAEPRFDFVVVDEVQDMTPVQLSLILKTLKRPGNFLLCGDSNQIVHPNFFSWSKVKSLFWHDPDLAAHQEVKVLRTNFRNSREATRIANTLLKIKHCRFGSIDRESNFLVQAVACDDGTVTVLADTDPVKRELNQKSMGSTRCAIIVLRDEDKAMARRFFQTPLIFSIHEAKGLEYETIILYRFVSDHRAEFAEIAAGVSPAAFAPDELAYRRAKDKTDKSLEIYKFFINALYVALTRAMKNVYWLESDTGHDLLALLNPRRGGEKVEMTAKTSTLEEWQKEARKLELQGKLEQAEAIRTIILKETPVPWAVFAEEHLRSTLIKVFRDRAAGIKPKQQLYDYACCYDAPFLANSLASDAAGYNAASLFMAQQRTIAARHLSSYAARNIKDVLRQCERHGLDHRNAMNQTPLMAASIVGNLPLVEALLERGADPSQTDDYGRNALHWAMNEAFHDARYAAGPFAALYELIAPASIDLMVGERLVRIDRHLSEYFLVQTMWTQFKRQLHGISWSRDAGCFKTETILKAWAHLPAHIVRPDRNKRPHISSVLSRNEVDR